ncbi:hypothetical protein [Nocardioides zeicaulis]|uniref:Uncharacterized protein n=1 Tax=Nocardioides zeicaulis TaxID=1776857 RepID=A0ABV6DZ62_9ACTN
MDDETYARELFAILTRPLDPDEPRDAYGTGADRIDRYGGFGTELVVTSVAAVPGPYGSRLEVGFRLEGPEGHDLPRTGTFHLPLAAEWREAQGYGAPSTYAPAVARATERAVGEHARRRRTAGRTVPLDRTEQHALLLEVLGGPSSVRQVAPDRFVLSRAGRERWVVVVTPEQWEQFLVRHGTHRASLSEHVEELLAAGSSDDRDEFLVFWEGDLVKSVREELPPVSGSVRGLLRAIERGPVPGAAWFAYTPVAPDRDA